jgi:TolA-binding protein
MKRTAVLITICIALILSAYAPAMAADQATGFWAKLKAKAQSVTPKKEAPTTTAVVGVRGADNEAEDTLYWKGKEKTIKVDAEELRKFNSALDTAMQGNRADASRLFSEFVAEYPESPLRADAQEALNKLRSGE